jgi:UDP-glucuronate 4-epimerase
MQRGQGFQIFNLGRSEVVTLKVLVEEIEAALGKKAKVVHQSEQPGDVRQTCADLSHSRSVLGYEPRIGIREGIRRFVEWYNAQPRG